MSVFLGYSKQTHIICSGLACQAFFFVPGHCVRASVVFESLAVNVLVKFTRFTQFYPDYRADLLVFLDFSTSNNSVLPDLPRLRWGRP